MTLDQFSSYAAAKGWKLVGSNAYGVYQGYPFSAALKEGRVSSVTVTFRLKKGLGGKAFRALNKALPKGCSVMQPQAGTVNLVCAGKEDSLEENLRLGMDETARALKEAMTVPPDTCPYCKQGGCDSLTAIGGGYTDKGANLAAAGVLGGAVGYAVARSTYPAAGYVPCHRACATERANSTVASAEKNMVSGSYLRGFIGALVGGLVGALPSVISVAFFNYYLAILYFLIPMAAWYGYKLLGGKQSKGTFWIIAVVCLFHTLFTIDQITFYIWIVQGYGLWLSPLESIPMYYQTFDASDIILDLLYPLIFLIAGLVTAYRSMSRTAGHDIQDAGVSLDTLSPYTPHANPEL